MSEANGEYPRLSGSPWRPASEPPKQMEWVIASADGVVRCVAWNSAKRCWEDWDGHGAINLDGIDWWMSIPDMPGHQWCTLPRWKKRLHGWLYYQMQSWVALLFAEAADRIMYKTLRDQFEEPNAGAQLQTK